MSDLVELSKELLNIKHNGSKAVKNLCDRILKLVYQYIYYRVDGISFHIAHGLHHCYLGSEKNSIYYSPHWGEIYVRTSFEEHKKARLAELHEYFKNNHVLSILKILEQCMPGLFDERLTFQESMALSSNEFSDPGLHFIVPPFLKQLNIITESIANIFKNIEVLNNINKLRHAIKIFEIQTAKDSVVNILHKIYIPIECLAYAPINLDIYQGEALRFTRLCLAIGLNLSNLISYDLLKISEENKEKAIKALGRKNSTIEEKINAGRILKYFSVPWYTIRNISALLFKASNKKDLKIFPEEMLIFEANKELSQDWKNLLPFLQELIVYELSVALGTINFDDVKYVELKESQYSLLKCLGSYAGDLLFLNKIIGVIQELDFEKDFLFETHLRVLAILGEAAKELSPQVLEIIGKNFWKNLSKLRDNIRHAGRFIRIMQKILMQNKEIEAKLKSDFQNLHKILREIVNQLPKTWEEIKKSYGEEEINIKVTSDNLGAGLALLLEAIDPVLTGKDRGNLHATAENINHEIEKYRDRLLEILQNQEINEEAQKEFSTLIEKLSPFLSKKNIKDLNETYKKLKQKKPAKLKSTTDKALREIDFPKSPKDILNRIDKLIKELKGMNKAENLKTRLNKMGILDEKDIQLWEQNRQKYYNNSNKNEKVKKKPNDNFDPWRIILGSIVAAKEVAKQLDVLNKLVHPKGQNDILSLDNFWKNPILHLAVEYYFVRIGTSLNDIQDALFQLQCHDVSNKTVLLLNELYRTLSSKLKNMVLYGNALAHLHDVIDDNGLTPIGQKFVNYQELFFTIKDYKILDSTKTLINRYIDAIKGIINQQIKDNRETYQSRYKWQQQVLAKLPDLKLTDYQILTQLNNLSQNEENKELKRQLFEATRALCKLNEEFISLQNIAICLNSEVIHSEKEKRSKSKTDDDNSEARYVDVGVNRYVFDEVQIRGDGWCALNAIGIANPQTAIEILKNRLKDAKIVNYIRRAIENNYQPTLQFQEDFDVEGTDSENNSIKDRITALYFNCQDKIDDSEYLKMIEYLERPEVQTAYLNYLLKSRYVDSNIAAACLDTEGKKLAMLACYGENRLANISEDNIFLQDENTICLIFYPGDRQSTAHYNLLNLRSVTPINTSDKNHLRQNDLNNVSFLPKVNDSSFAKKPQPKPTPDKSDNLHGNQEEQPINKENLKDLIENRNYYLSIIKDYLEKSEAIDPKIGDLLMLAIKETQQRNLVFDLHVKNQNLKDQELIKYYLEDYAGNNENELFLKFFEIAKFIQNLNNKVSTKIEEKQEALSFQHGDVLNIQNNSRVNQNLPQQQQENEKKEYELN